jgi:hypothetical protein
MSLLLLVVATTFGVGAASGQSKSEANVRFGEVVFGVECPDPT